MRVGHLSARCPKPFAMVGCTCFAPFRNCYGERFVKAAAGSHGGGGMCNVSYSTDLHNGFGPLGSVAMYINCLWRGDHTHLVTKKDETKDLTCADASKGAAGIWAKGNEEMVKLMTKEVRERKREIQRLRDVLVAGRVVQRTLSSGGTMMVVGALLMALCCCCCCRLTPRDCSRRLFDRVPCLGVLARLVLRCEGSIGAVVDGGGTNSRHHRRIADSDDDRFYDGGGGGMGHLEQQHDFERPGASMLGARRLEPPSESSLHQVAEPRRES